MLRVDEWTAETAPHVVAARAAGEQVTCLAEDVLVCSGAPVIGVTGTAGKTTTSYRLRAILEAAGRSVAMATGARAGNAWPDEGLLARVPSLGSTDLVLCELTSTHLCYMEHSPQVAVVTCLWPDHVELHGSVERYVAAKARILAAQQPGDLALLGPGCDPLVGIGAARQLRFEGDPAEAVARALGIDTAAIAAGCAADLALPHRFHELGARDGVRVIDDGMAATPAKSTAALRRLAGERVVLLAGGHDQAGVHRAGAEVAMLDAACQAAAACRAVVVFGSAAERLRGRIPGAVVATDLEAAIDAGVRLAKVGDVLLLAPMFPLTMEERQSFATRFQG